MIVPLIKMAILGVHSSFSDTRYTIDVLQIPLYAIS
jgi:hypothetical protein